MWNFLGSLEETRTEGDAMFVHGSPRVPTKEYMVPTDISNREKMNELFSMIPSICFVGHSHIPGVYTDTFQFLNPERIGGAYTHQGGKALVNVGSVGQPRDGDPRAMYALFDATRAQLTFHRVSYNHHAAAEAVRRAGLPGFFADRLELGR
jgi:diadenosine tetraphosphatase ApaH/serine/threonine PP2A family protein phosphatase